MDSRREAQPLHPTLPHRIKITPLPVFVRFLSLLTVLILAAGLPLAEAGIASPAQATPPDESMAERLNNLSAFDADEVLWLARCIYSESNRPHEQELVAWVVRNRVETNFRGSTYRDVVLEDRQFSAFNAPSVRRSRILGLDASSSAPGWQKALKIAFDVFNAPASERPFAQATRHFYSPISMRGRIKPHWAQNEKPLSSEALGVQSHRFQFFEGIDADAEAPALAVEPPHEGGSRAVRGDRTVDARTLRQRMRSRSSGRVPRPASPSVERPDR